MKTFLATVLLIVAPTLWAADAPKSALPVLYLGNVPSDRAAAYEKLLREHFADVEVAARDGFDAASVDPKRVVLLDWSQSDIDLSDMAKVASPLGHRAKWKNPTVLLGSAGLLMAGPWKITGASG